LKLTDIPANWRYTMKIFIPLFFVLSFSSLVYPQTVSNVRFESYDDSVVVFYDLQGDANQEYNVSLTLKREEFVTFQVVPKHVIGDIGNGIAPGLKRRIVWNPTHEFIISPDITDYYFEVKASIASGSLSDDLRTVSSPVFTSMALIGGISTGEGR